METSPHTHRILTIASVAIAMLATVLAVLVVKEQRETGTVSSLYTTPAGQVRRLSDVNLSAIPNPFQPKTLDLGATIESVSTRTIGGMTVGVYGISLYDDTDANRSQAMVKNTIYFILTPDIASMETEPFDHAIRSLVGATDGAAINYYGYMYSNVNADQEQLHRNDSLFASRFPSIFFASQKTLTTNAADIAAFQSGNGVTFRNTNATANGARFMKNALYIIVLNETAGAKVVLFPPKVCGDGWKVSTEVCDDGNIVSGDGCSALCTMENGYNCTGNPSVCTVTGGSSSAFSSVSSSSASSQQGYSTSGMEYSSASSISSNGSTGSSGSAGSSAGSAGSSGSNGSSGSSGSSGGSTSSVSSATGSGTCGDGTVDGTEECDLGPQNGQPGSTCTSDCKISAPLPF